MDVSVVDEVDVVVPLWQLPPWALKLPVIPMAWRLTAVVPVLVTWIVNVVVDPDADRLRRLALRLPLANCRNLPSFPDREFLHPMVFSPWPSDCLRTPTEDGTSV